MTAASELMDVLEDSQARILKDIVEFHPVEFLRSKPTSHHPGVLRGKILPSPWLMIAKATDERRGGFADRGHRG